MTLYHKYLRNLCCFTFWSMKLLFRAYFHHKKISEQKLEKNLLESGSGRFRKSDPDPVKNRPDPQHWLGRGGEGSCGQTHDVLGVTHRDTIHVFTYIIELLLVPSSPLQRQNGAGWLNYGQSPHRRSHRLRVTPGSGPPPLYSKCGG
jgi:hypothetical protein